jgi:tRNA 2-thiouridine synthesizing protein A
MWFSEIPMAEKTLDATGLSCPLPVLKARKALREMAPGQTLELLATDPGAVEDIPAFCLTAGHELLESSIIDHDMYRFVIKNGGERVYSK